jgi:transposase
MFIRSIKVPSSSGAVHEYVRIVESLRENGRVKQKVVANLGRRDTLEAVLPLLNRFLRGDEDATKLAKQQPLPPGVEALDASAWGPMRVTRYLGEQLGLWQILDAGRRWPKLLPDEDRNDDWCSRVLVLLTNRLTHPKSEHGLASWLEEHFVCDRDGRRYVAFWKQRERVRVHPTQLQRWYRTLDHLYLNKNDIEVALYRRLRDLFDFRPDLVLYDLTSTYFTGHGPAIAKHGHSRDGKPRELQIVIGVVMVAGWPIAHHVWAGNTRDSTTVKQVLDDLAKRFEFRRIVFVGDRGMVTHQNLKFLHAEDGSRGFLVGMTRRQNPEAELLIDRVQEQNWLECAMGINAREQSEEDRPRTRVQEVCCDRADVRVFVIDSDERREYETRMREKTMARVRGGLERVQKRVLKGQLKKPEKIGSAVERVLQRNHGHRYYTWELKDGQLRFFEHPVNLAREKKYEGKYLIQTDQCDITPEDAVAYYKELNEVERGFRSMKDPIGMRPIWHHSERRVRAHIFVAALAFLLDRMLERKLRDAKSTLSSPSAWEALKTIKLVQFRIDGELRSTVTPGSAHARHVMKVLGLTEVAPPSPPAGEETTM